MILYTLCRRGRAPSRVEGEGETRSRAWSRRCRLLPRTTGIWWVSDPEPADGVVVIYPKAKGSGGCSRSITAAAEGRKTHTDVCGYSACYSCEGQPGDIQLAVAAEARCRARRGSRMDPSTFQYAADEVSRRQSMFGDRAAKLSENCCSSKPWAYAEGLPQGENGWLAGYATHTLPRAVGTAPETSRGAWEGEDLSREVGLYRRRWPTASLADR